MSDLSAAMPLASEESCPTDFVMSEHTLGMPAHPVFPFEIWELILKFTVNDFRNCKSQDDLIHLWTCVRPVCKQLKAEVEDIFKTQHLSKTTLHFLTDTYYADYDTFSRSRADIWATWGRTPVDHVQQHDFRIQLRFAGLVEKEPGRAIFKMRHWSNDPNHPDNLYEGVIFRHMREKGGLGPAGEADKYRPSERRRLFGESEDWGPPSHPIPIFEPQVTEGMFVVQVRAGLNDCAVPGLRIDQDKREISFNWVGLFSQFFGERRAVDLHRGMDRGLAYPWLPAEQYPLSDRHSILPSDPLLEHLDSALIKVAIRDYEQLYELFHEIDMLTPLFVRTGDPIRTWRNDMGRFVGRERLSIGSVLLKRHCDREVNLDDEGNVDKTQVDEEVLRVQGKVNVFKEADIACDPCRLEDHKCFRRWKFDNLGHLSRCFDCRKDRRCCSYQLAELRSRWYLSSPASLPSPSILLSSQVPPVHAENGLSASSLESRVLQRVRTVASRRIDGPFHQPGIPSCTQPSMSQQPQLENNHNLRAGAKTDKEAEVNTSTCAAKSAWDCAEADMKSHKKSRIRQAMEVRGHGKLFETSEHWSERHCSAENTEIHCSHGKDKISKAKLIDRGGNGKKEDLESWVDDVVDDGIPSYISDHPLVEEYHRDGHQLTNDATLSSSSPVQFQTPKIRESVPAPNPLQKRGVSEVPYKPSTRRSQATTSQELVIRRPRLRFADKPSDQDQFSFSRQAASIDFHKNLIVETAHDDEQQSTLIFSTKGGVRIKEIDQHGRQRSYPAQPSSFSQSATTKVVNLRRRSEPILSLSSSVMVFKNPTKGSVLPLLNAHVLPSTQSAIYADSLSLANRQRAESSYKSVNPMYTLFSQFKYLQRKVNEFMRTVAPRVPLCSLLSLGQQVTDQAKMSVSFKILEPPDAEFCISSRLLLKFGPIHMTSRSANSDEESKTERAFMILISPPLRISLPTLRDLMVGDVWRMHNINEATNGDGWMSGSEIIALTTEHMKRIDGDVGHLPIDWSQDGRPPWLVSHFPATCTRTLTLPASCYTNSSYRLPAICSAPATQVIGHGWSLAINKYDEGDNDDDVDGDGAPQPDATEISIREFLDVKNTECMIDAAKMTICPDIHELVLPTIVRTGAAQPPPDPELNNSKDRNASLRVASSNTADPAILHVNHTENDGNSRAICDSIQYSHNADATPGSPLSEMLFLAREGRHPHIIYEPSIHINKAVDTNSKPAIPATITHAVRKRLPHQGPCQPSPRPRRAQLSRTKFPRGRCHMQSAHGTQVPKARSTNPAIHSTSKRFKVQKHLDSPPPRKPTTSHKYISLPEDPAPFHRGQNEQPALEQGKSSEPDQHPYNPAASQDQAQGDIPPPKPSTPHTTTMARKQPGHINQRQTLQPTKSPQHGRHGRFKL